MYTYVYIHFYSAQPHMLGANPAAVYVHHEALNPATYQHKSFCIFSSYHPSVFNKQTRTTVCTVQVGSCQWQIFPATNGYCACVRSLSDIIEGSSPGHAFLQQLFHAIRQCIAFLTQIGSALWCCIRLCSPTEPHVATAED